MVTELEFVLRNLLEEERRRAGGADEERKIVLRSMISGRKAGWDSDSLFRMFKDYISRLPEEIRPKTELEEHRLFPKWEDGLKRELADWSRELESLESKVPDGRLVYGSVRGRVIQALEFVAQETGVLPQAPRLGAFEGDDDPLQPGFEGWVSFERLFRERRNGGGELRLVRFRDLDGNEIDVGSWIDLIVQTAEWLIQGGFISDSDGPIKVGRRYLINPSPFNAKGTRLVNSKKLSNGFYLDSSIGSKDIARLCVQLLSRFGHDPAQFHVLLG